MRPQTRKLVRLVADDLTDAIFGALQGEPQSAEELLGQLETSEKTLYRRLKELEQEELVEPVISPRLPGKAGRPSRRYRIADPAVIHFRNAANVFGLAHAERLTEGAEAEIDADREKQVQPADEGSA